MFIIISCFEVALRNKINIHYCRVHGAHWLRDAQRPGGIFSNRRNRFTSGIISNSYNRLGINYTHDKLVAAMDFGFWRYLFAQPQFHAGGQSLLAVFPKKPTSTRNSQYNHSFIFDELKKVNDIRNRIAHHEPICFRNGHAIIDTRFLREKHTVVLKLFSWMEIEPKQLFYGLDHIEEYMNKVNSLK